MRYGSVCSGIEAATMAWHPLGWTPAFFSEIEAFPSAVLAHHYGSNIPGEPLAKNGIPNHGDFTQIGSSAGPIDLLVGGTPCQSFSVAGKRLGLDDPRGNLALEYLSLARRLRARWIVWENVPGVVSSVTDEEDGEGGIQPGIEGREAGDEWIEESDFATFLSFVRECGYGFAYRVLDAQFVRVDGFGRAVPQRRRRVFVVGYLGDWRRAAAVLLEPQGMRGDSAPRREPGKGTAGTIDASAARSRGAGVNPGMIVSVNDVIAKDVAPTLNAAFGQKLGLENQHIDGGAGMFVAHTLLGKENSSHQADRETYIAFDCKASALAIRGRGDSHQLEYRQDGTANAVLTPNGGRAGIGVGAIAWSIMPQNSGKDYKVRQVEVSQPVMAGGPVGGNQGGDYIQSDWAVRRLTPTECERLQGFPDNYTNIPWGKKDTSPDGPRYKALGNSMAVNAMRWIGMRIQMVEDVCSRLEAAE